jgi:hypothetical protein
MPIMFTEAALLLGPSFAVRRARRCRVGREFETLAKMQGADIDQLDPVLMREAIGRCARCACRRACRRWPKRDCINAGQRPDLAPDSRSVK